MQQPAPLQTASVIYLPLVQRSEAATATSTSIPATPIATPTSTSVVAPTQTPAQTPAPTPTPIDATPSSTEVVLGVAVPQSVQTDMGSLRLLAVSAVYYASQTANLGTTVTTGTLTVVDQNTATYDPAPSDRLRVLFADGRTLEVVVTAINGSDGSSPENFLNSTHHFEATIVTGAPVANPDPNLNMPPNANIQLTSTQANGTSRITAAGMMAVDNQPYTVDVTAEGTSFFDSSGGSVHRGNDYAFTGTINATLNGSPLAIVLDERYKNELISDRRVSVSTADTAIKNSWSYQGQQYQLANGLIRRSFENGYVNESEIDSYWQATGQLLRNGEEIGGLSLNLNALYMEVLLTADGNDTLLQRFRRPTTIAP